MRSEDFIHMPIPASMFTAVCALLGGASVGAIAALPAAAPAPKPAAAPAGEGDGPQATALKASGSDAAAAAADDAGTGAADGTLDAGGHPWSADLHASTKGVTKDGYWRMKVGVSRPADLPGFPKTGAAPTAAAAPTENGAASAQSTQDATATVEDEDEFAAFRAAADKAGATDAAAAASVPARKWTDADLGALCNQAAVKFGDPAPVKAIIQDFVAADAVPHSRNIPDDKREAFAQAVEKKADITFAG